MDSAYYKEYYDLERQHWWFRVRAKIIAERLEAQLDGRRDLRILNIGAATGRSTELLSAYGKVTSIEYDADCCAYTNERLGLNILNASILELPFEKEEFDLVCAFDVIEHVEEDGQAVAEMKRVCKRDGILYITVPAFMSLWSHHDVVNQHFRRYTMSQIKQLFNSSREKIVCKTYFNFFLYFPILAFRLLSRLIPDRWIRKEAGSDFTVVGQDNWINRLFYLIFDLERKLLKWIKFPIGVSILFMMKKN